jgi:DNA-directed RNA polymerase subunit RPC12/RpoP
MTLHFHSFIPSTTIISFTLAIPRRRCPPCGVRISVSTRTPSMNILHLSYRRVTAKYAHSQPPTQKETSQIDSK